jgi:hypothetical protein
MTNRPTFTHYGCETYYALKVAGWTESAPFAAGDATNPLRVMTPPGYRGPAKRTARRCLGERAPADRRR